jgi:hypothetical protein
MDKKLLVKLYLKDKLSMAEIAKLTNCSINKIVYWMGVHELKRRSRSEATYIKRNPNGDPFLLRPVITIEDAWLKGLGIGLYWGEGNKRNKWSVRLGNTDPILINYFIAFLERFFSIKKEDLSFSLQIFTDINVDDALLYWTHKLKVTVSQFIRPTVTISGSIGTYRHKSQYGVVTVMYHNTKLRDILVDMLPR